MLDYMNAVAGSRTVDEMFMSATAMISKFRFTNFLTIGTKAIVNWK